MNDFNAKAGTRSRTWPREQQTDRASYLWLEAYLPTSDPDIPANTLTFSLSGEPAGASITAGGDFTWTPSESQGPGMYTFDVVVTDDGAGLLSDSEPITVTVNEVNVAPTITSSASQMIDENLTAVETLTATDPDIPVQTLTWSKTGGGDDQAEFSITAGGALSFNSPPDYELPTDVGMDNFYEVEVQVSDGVDATTQLVTVEVKDIAVEAIPPVANDEQMGYKLLKNAARSWSARSSKVFVSSP